MWILNHLEVMPDAAQRKRLTREQKTGFVLLLIFGALAIGLGFLQIRNTMYKPFALNNKVALTSDDVKSVVKSIDALRYRDSDNDGLSDYDELYVYGTSPYLWSTAGDSMSDGEKVKLGKNPLCNIKTGKCLSAETSGALSTSSTGIILGQSSTENTSTYSASASLGSASSTITSLNNSLTDPTQLRSMLVESGVQKSLLDKLSDKQLLNLVKDIMSPTTTYGKMFSSFTSSSQASTSTQ